MDQVKSNRSCSIHPNNRVEFIQINNVTNEQEKSLFYCSACINEDLSFKGIDYLLVEQIISCSSSQVIQKWPPVSDQQVIDDLISVTSTKRGAQTLEEQIIKFFDSLKKDIALKIDAIQKRMVNQAKELPFERNQIIGKYQEISKISQLKLLLEESVYGKNTNERACKELIAQVQSEKEANTKELVSLLDTYHQNQKQINYELPKRIKSIILNTIGEINFFQSDSINTHNTNQSPITSKQSLVDTLLDLASNKTNYCSDEYLNQLKQQLAMITPILPSIPTCNQYQSNKKPIKFDELTAPQLDMIENMANHYTQMNKNAEYIDSIRNSQQIESIKKIFSNKTNFISSEFYPAFESFLIESYPCLEKCIDQNKEIVNQKYLEQFLKLSDEASVDLLELSKKINHINQTISAKSALLNNVKSVINQHYLYIEQNQIDNILSKYPIFDLLKEPESLDILPHIQLIKGNYQGSEKYLQITRLQNQKIEVCQRKDYWTNIVSNIVLEKEKKYVFRFEVSRSDLLEKYVHIGLMQESNVNSKGGYEDLLSCLLQFNQNQVQKYSNYGIDKKLKGDDFKLSSENILELRVCLQDKLLEVHDFPIYSKQFGLSEKSKQNLANLKDLKLYIGMRDINCKVTLKDAFIVKNF